MWAPATAPASSFDTMPSASSFPIPTAARAWKTVNRASMAALWWWLMRASSWP
ncbi:hypothetical protein ACIRRX_26765 [Streptomyces bacillaris]|uniref:hypothetical protein n=1 Tax=unclassified Streptomyces TaxID=2593676 RepID=UPI00131A2D4F|nr:MULTISPECIES: hypothetical protein [unclassified Streptomyces]MYT40647.1 hypothetical protein [Streptomyces sp. SID8356]